MKTSQLLTLAVATLGLTTGAVAQRNNNRNGGNNGGNTGASTTNAAAAAASTTAAAAGGNNGNTGNNNAAGGNGGNNDLLLLASNVQAASNFAGNPDVAAGQSNSDTDPANFINFCTGKTLTNGTQNTAGSCNGVIMGDIPSNNNMVSAIVLFPGPGDDLTPNQSFNIQVQLTNLVAGSFTDPLTTYYSAPQELQGGNIVGHCHVTVQDLGNSLAPTTPPDPKTFAFFKGINDDGNGQGLLQATVANGLPAGFYRVCTMNSASNHQPVLMPVAQRGAQDDCQKFTVGQGTGNAGGNAGGNAAGGNGGNNNNAAASSTTAAAAATSAATGNGNGAGNGNANGNGNGAAATTSAAASTQTGSTGSNSTTGGNTGSGRGGRFGGGRGRFGRGRGRFAARDLIA
ncbi:uncharacterized protein Z519_12530 [Cladophialophora bantiana CBS 173.52]|uniref:Ribosomal protein s17 n=1 Tax=Cladophialophora bantiana (strain ATCC 10958 / CBS 173.52 / CDC B-1940 / NIH 8579) TaxID=1442370 RepID=A0A0D2H0V5_CLAB1|nr:uncharacterized protein Z519_12530 [Cladophialophora bantiana CBS 173.52]KIW86908.1 hypothetical protein Z519_12530 [Cladophialophora bantiana CBS 173.52]